MTTGHDERNLGRLGLISAQKTVPATLRTWSRDITLPDGRPASILCSVSEGQTVPHGLDNDVMVGLISLCFEAGLPSDGKFSTSAYRLLKACGFPTTVQYYRILEEALKRLTDAKYTIKEGWFRQGEQMWSTQMFSQIMYLAYNARSALGGGSVITVRLADPITENLRAGYIKPLDVGFYTSLSQPLVRALYRQLDARRFDEHRSDGLAPGFQVGLRDWAASLGILSQRSDKVREALSGAHQELVERDYLQDAKWSGRGMSATLEYVFADLPQTQRPELVEMMLARGVKRGMALRLTTLFPDRIPEAARRFDRYLQTAKTPIGNRGGLMVAMVTRPEDYAGLDDAGLSPAPSSTERPARPPRTRAQREQDEAQLEARNEAEVAVLSGQALLDWVLRQLSLTGVLKHLNALDRSRLGELVLHGQIDGRQLVRRALQSLSQGPAAQDEVRAELRQLLDGTWSPAVGS
ncbi:Replication initiator protein A [Deinococcus hopiensis KR-140]|uniref:Replication initiator protein A n=2 Tax=Deinococcus TaxID=1298 RepID=A0A1W1UVT3_9DEIO|nr:Replication initiator protein A [Deinococcus hopiensis KR-140]